MRQRKKKVVQIRKKYGSSKNFLTLKKIIENIYIFVWKNF